MGVVVGFRWLVRLAFFTKIQRFKLKKIARLNSIPASSKRFAAQGVEAGAEVQSFIDTSKATEYSVLAALQLAKAQVEAGELDQALTQLQWAQANTKDAAVSPLVTYRIARIMAEQENIDGARAELDKITDEAWAGRVAELRGDIAN